MKILITGGCGFVGANIALFLNSKGYKIESLDNLSRKGSNYNLNLLKFSSSLDAVWDVSQCATINEFQEHLDIWIRILPKWKANPNRP